jgi:saccharopepsin
MSFTGKWVNEYQSVMTLHQHPNGLVSGDYASTTGSVGRYYVLGYASPQEPTPQLGQPVALSIYWRSYVGGTPDPSWHWVSGLSGQLQLSPAPVNITLMHAMVATTEYPGFVPPGTWVDKLKYLPDKSPEPVPTPTDTGGVSGPITGNWLCQEPNAMLTITPAPPPHFFGAVEGVLTLSGQPSFAVVGFTDIDAQPQSVPRQALSVSGYDGQGNRCFSLAGSLDIASDTLTLTVYITRATSYDERYVQTRAEVWKFIRG